MVLQYRLEEATRKAEEKAKEATIKATEEERQRTIRNMVSSLRENNIDDVKIFDVLLGVYGKYLTPAQIKTIMQEAK